MGATSTGTARRLLRKKMAFQKTWRVYQRRVLDQLDSYLEDKRFHLVSAPGSGKTVLGLEVIRRIGHPALVLAPTITIRDQWADRLVDCFLPAGHGRPAWVSTDIKTPGLITIATYQSLHSICSDGHGRELESAADKEGEGSRTTHQDKNEDPEPDTFIQFPRTLLKAKFRTLVVDEAHHLRAEWWKTL